MRIEGRECRVHLASLLLLPFLSVHEGVATCTGAASNRPDVSARASLQQSTSRRAGRQYRRIEVRRATNDVRNDEGTLMHRTRCLHA